MAASLSHAYLPLVAGVLRRNTWLPVLLVPLQKPRRCLRRSYTTCLLTPPRTARDAATKLPRDSAGPDATMKRWPEYLQSGLLVCEVALEGRVLSEVCTIKFPRTGPTQPRSAEPPNTNPNPNIYRLTLTPTPLLGHHTLSGTTLSLSPRAASTCGAHWISHLARRRCVL